MGAEEPSPDLLRSGLLELGIEPDRTEVLVPPLWSFATLLYEWTQRIRLTGHRSLEAIVRRLVLDAVGLARALPEIRDARALVDLGSGPGLPGIPIALLYPSCEVFLVEARERPHYFQREAVRRLRIPNVQPLRGRAQELAPRPADIVVAQAMARPAEALKRMLPWALPGGLLVIAAAAEPPRLTLPQGLQAEVGRAYRVSLDGPRRSLWLGRRLLE